MHQSMNTIKTSLTDIDAKKIGELLGYKENKQRYGRRFYAYLKGEVKNWNYDETIHWGDISRIIIPIIELLKENNYFIPKN